MPVDSEVTIVTVYPDLLGTYGDGGNGSVLRGRLVARGMRASLLEVRSSTPVPETADIYLLGGGEDAPQIEAARRLRTSGALSKAVGNGAVVFAVCAGLQIIGETFVDGDDKPIDGLGLLDLRTTKMGGPRAVGEILLESSLPGYSGRISGYENHSGGTQLGAGVKPIGRVLVGTGNDRHSRSDGAFSEKVVATYLHGPVLARNPKLADYLLKLIVGEMPAIQDRTLVQLGKQLHGDRVAAAYRSDSKKGVLSAWRSLRG